MRAKRISTVLLIITASTLLLVLAFHVRIGATADSVAVLETTGMTCSSCSSKITKALETLKGVAATEVDVKGGWVIVGYDTKIVRPESLAEKVSETGFKCNVYDVLTPEQFRQITGRNVRQNAACCDGKSGGCGRNKQN